MIFQSLRKRLSKAPTEAAPQLTQWQQREAESPIPGGRLPYAKYDEMEQDGMIQTALSLKRLGVVAAGWQIVPGDDSRDAQERATFAERAMQRLSGSALTILIQAMDSFSKGWSIQELVFTEQDGRCWLEAVRPKDPANFGIELNAFGAITGLRLSLPGEAERVLPRSKFVIHRHRGGYGRPKGRSDLDAVYPHYLAKQRLLEAWRLHLEKFASPTVYGKMPSGMSGAQQQALLEALNRLDRHAAVTFPTEVEVGLIGDKNQGSEGFLAAIEFHNREMARAILGQTLTTDEGSRIGSLALGRVHLQVLLLQLQALRRELADEVMTEQVLRPLDECNFGPGPSPRFVFEEATINAFLTGQV